ncbi:hypothetical protein ACJX0J_035903, partial [Zea mays]
FIAFLTISLSLQIDLNIHTNKTSNYYDLRYFGMMIKKGSAEKSNCDNHFFLYLFKNKLTIDCYNIMNSAITPLRAIDIWGWLGLGAVADVRLIENNFEAVGNSSRIPFGLVK